MKTRIVILLNIFFLLLACEGTQKREKEVDPDSNFSMKQTNDNAEIKKNISLKYNFEIQVAKGEDFERFVTFTSFLLKHNSKEIFKDTSLTEYEFGDDQYPIINSIGEDAFELLVEINDRPNKNYLKYFKIRNDSIIEQSELPTFIAKSSNLDNDENVEYAGFWDYSQIWGENDDSIAYNHIIYFEQTPKGILLDTVLTIEKNTEIYGTFNGFNFGEGKAVSYKETKSKFEKELNRIKNN